MQDIHINRRCLKIAIKCWADTFFFSLIFLSYIKVESLLCLPTVLPAGQVKPWIELSQLASNTYNVHTSAVELRYQALKLKFSKQNVTKH